MLQNATLLRIDPPSPAPEGSPLGIRCALAAPTAGEMQWLIAASITASAVLYIPLDNMDPPAVETGDRLMIALDGCALAPWNVTHANQRVGDVLRYMQIFLTAIA